jgi:hypothetical protein
MRAKDALAGKLFELFGPKGWDIRDEDIVGTI